MMKLLLVSSRFPWPPWRGNQLRTVQWIGALAEHDHLLLCPPADDMTGVALCDAEFRDLPTSVAAKAFGMAAAILRGRPAQEGLYDSSSSRKAVADAVRDFNPDLAVIQMVRCGWAADAIRGVDPGIPILFDAIDCMTLHYRRAAESAPPVLRSLYRFEAERCRRREADLVRNAAVTTAVSARDLRALDAGAGGMVVAVTGGNAGADDEPSAAEPIVILSGNLGYRPTIRAALWFADRVWPKVLESVPSAVWVLAGARPAGAVRQLVSRPRVEVHSNVDDLGRFLRRARVAIAPMASGSGVPIKILEAMAAGVPVVADPWSADGLEDPSAVVAAHDEVEWIDALRRLLTDSGAAREQAMKGTEVWRAHYAPDRVGAQIRTAVQAAARAPRD